MGLGNKLGKLKSVQKTLKGVQEQAQELINIAIIADSKAQKDLLKTLGVDEQNKVLISISSKSSHQHNEDILQASDLAVVLIAPEISNDTLRMLVKLAITARHRMVVVLGRDVNPRLQSKLSELMDIPASNVLFLHVDNVCDVNEHLIPKIVSLLHHKEIALAARIPAFRDCVAGKLISKSAAQNGLIGAAFFLPGTDMAVMTLNQIRMVLQLTAAYNEEVSIARLSEILAVVAGGFAFRSISRQIVSLMPAVGWAVKGSIGYGGTIAMGELTKKYLESAVENQEKGEPVDSLGTDRATSEERSKTQSIH